ncbi:hypothetical protein J6590_068890 [Homalodisca vitripennis]|nr:hypothetical protein J6590_068890 [Homalodisca vitripennis]
MLTRRENLLIRPWQERRYINHRNKVESALPAIDVRPPAQRQHVACKLKKQQKEAERCERIHQDNFTLLQHLSSIMKTNRLDNYWVEAPPNFLHRVGIYHMREYKEPDLSTLDFSQNLHSRKERCLGCNPSLMPNKVRIPEERVPWEAPRKRISRRSSSFMNESDISCGVNVLRPENLGNFTRQCSSTFFLVQNVSANKTQHLRITPDSLLLI